MIDLVFSNTPLFLRLIGDKLEEFVRENVYELVSYLKRNVRTEQGRVYVLISKPLDIDFYFHPECFFLVSLDITEQFSYENYKSDKLKDILSDLIIKALCST